MKRDDVYEKGLNIRKEVMGAANVEARLKASTEFMQPLQTMISKWAYGESGAATSCRAKCAACWCSR